MDRAWDGLGEGVGSGLCRGWPRCPRGDRTGARAGLWKVMTLVEDKLS